MSTKPFGPTLSVLALAAIVSAAVVPASLAAYKTVKIGALLPMSGPGSYFGAQDKQGIELALEALNKTGVNGFKFEVQYEDSACSPLPATQAAKRILDQYHRSGQSLDVPHHAERGDAGDRHRDPCLQDARRPYRGPAL